MKRIEPAHLHGDSNGLSISSSSAKQIRQTGNSSFDYDILCFLSIAFSNLLAFSFFGLIYASYVY
jgi:hypothetical protein